MCQNYDLSFPLFVFNRKEIRMKILTKRTSFRQNHLVYAYEDSNQNGKPPNDGELYDVPSGVDDDGNPTGWVKDCLGDGDECLKAAYP